MKSGIILISVLLMSSAAIAEIQGSQVVISPLKSGLTPQVPRLSPDQKLLLFEVTSSQGTELWLSAATGGESHSMTKKLQDKKALPRIVENATWHPSGNFIAFEGRDNSSISSSKIYVAKLEGLEIKEFKSISLGRRPQFSQPYGHVLFLEKPVGILNSTVLNYFIVGSDPMNPRDLAPVPLRGPLQKVKGMEFTHPALAKDGNTIYFAAETALSVAQEAAGPEFPQIIQILQINSAARQRVIELWPSYSGAKIPAAQITKALASISPVFSKVDTPLVARDYGKELNAELVKDLNLKKQTLTKTQSGIARMNQRELLLFWMLGLLPRTDLTPMAVEDLLASRIWVTDIFGGEIKSVITSGGAIPQKYPAPSQDGKYLVFEAGNFKNRHLYVASTTTGKAVQLTKKGSYNSSPELSLDNQTVFYESNEGGGKEIRSAKLNWLDIRKELSE